MIEAVTFDLDSTIADTLHRQWMVDEIMAKKPGAPTWDDYSMECVDDTPIAGTVALMRMLSSQGMLIFIVTGRSAAAKTMTRHWLEQNDIPCDALVMRPAGDRTPNGKFKVEKIRYLAELDYKVILHVEDSPDIAKYIQEHTGIPVLLVNPAYPEDRIAGISGV
jgi:predicted secreted acid phosphatase